MRIPAADVWSRAGARGLTLIELLVVMVILGVMSSLVLVSLPDQTQLNARRGAEDAASMVRSLSAAAVTDGVTRGLSVENGVLTAYAFRGGIWQPVTTLTSATDDNGIFLSLTLEDGFAFPEADEEEGPDVFDEDDVVPAPEQEPPAVVLSPVGEVTPFTLLLEQRRARFQVSVSALGDIEVDDAL